MELSDLVGRAQDAMDRGEYRLVVASCGHALEAYPTCLSLHRMLGEAHLEQGETEPAIEHFERALYLDPLNVYVRLGLGVAFEERSDPRGAYAHYLHAWELNPALDQLRDELLRLRTVLGATGRLHPTRAGLAAIYARGGRLSRAATEWRAVLAADGENSWARMALAEVLWRQGDDAGAAAACQTALGDVPENVRALAILAEIERRKQGLHAKTYADRYRAIDPIGDVVHGIVEMRPGADFSFLMADHAFVEEFDFDQALDDLGSMQADETDATPTPPVLRHSSHLAAPDLWDSLVKDLEHDTTAIVAPFNWADDTGSVGSDAGVADSHLSLDEVLAAEGIASEQPAALAEAEPLLTASIVGTDPHDGALPRPDRNEAEGDDHVTILVATRPHGAAAAETHAAPPLAAVSVEQEVVRGYTASLSDIEPFNFGPADEAVYAEDDPLSFAPEDDVGLAEDLVVAPETAAEGAVTPSDLVDTVAAMAFEPDLEPVLEPVFEHVGESIKAAAPAPTHGDQFITADGHVDLTVGWDDLDRTLQEATPNPGAVTGFDSLVAEFDAGGIAPFDLLAPTGDESAWEPFTDDDVTAPAELVASAAAPLSPSEPEPTLEVAGALGELAEESWTSLEAELASAIPDDLTSGYTEVFRNLDESERLEPYVPSPDEVVVDPLAVPDAVGEPLVFADLLAVTSQDATGPLDEQTGDAASDEFESLAPAPLRVAPTAEAAEFDWEAALTPDIAEFAPLAVEPMVEAVGWTTAEDSANTMEAPDREDFITVSVDTTADIEAIAPSEAVVMEAGTLNESERWESEPVGEDWPAWPTFIGAFGESEDQRRATGGIFAQMREEKDARVSAGIEVVDRCLTAAIPAARQHSGSNGTPSMPGIDSPDTREDASGADDAAGDLTSLRDQLRRGDVTAADVAELLEALTANGEASPMALRVLGEAYLELGRTDQAVVMLRQAMATRSA